MGRVRPYDREAGRALLERALERSGYPDTLTLREFAREELVRDEATVRAYMKGRALIPAVVRDKLKRLARRRRSAPRTTF